MGRTVDECRAIVKRGEYSVAEMAFVMGRADADAAKPVVTQRVDDGVTRIVNLVENDNLNGDMP